jgi:hypothetical protein
MPEVVQKIHHGIPAIDDGACKYAHYDEQDDYCQPDAAAEMEVFRFFGRKVSQAAVDFFPFCQFFKFFLSQWSYLENSPVIAIYKSEILKAGENTFRGFVFGQCISAKHSMNIIYIGLLRDRAPVIKYFQEFEFFFCHDKQAIECLGNCTEILQRTIDECESIDFL